MEMLKISKEERLLSKPVSLATSSEAVDFFLLSLESTEVLYHTRLNISLLTQLIFPQFLSVFYFTSCSFFCLQLSYVLPKTLYVSTNVTCVCYFTIRIVLVIRHANF